MRSLSLLASALLLPACDADCADGTRVNGTYRVESNVSDDDWVVTGWEDGPMTDESDHLMGLFVNGSATWDLRQLSASDALRVTIDGQAFEAALSTAEDNCNRLELEMEGSWANPQNGSTHQFLWIADLLWTGDALSGSWSYEDQWTLEDRTGSVSLPSGELQGSLRDAGNQQSKALNPAGMR